MTIRITALALIIAAVSTSGASAQNAQTREGKLMVQVGVFTPAGSAAIENADTQGASFSGGVIVTNNCGVGAGDYWSTINMPERARDAWELKGRVLSLSDTQAVVYVEWRRVRTAGVDSSSPAQAQTLTLPVDEPQILDRAGPPADDCSPDFVPVFGARYAMWPPITTVPKNAAVSATGQTAGAQPFTAELWLVHHAPGRPDDVKATTVQLTETGVFNFGILQFTTSGGVLGVRVNGQLRLVNGQKMLQLDATRAAAFTPGSDPPRDRVPLRPEGRANVWRLLPGPDEVIEFEMPPLDLSSAPKLPDAFAIRLRIRPIK